MVFKRAESDTGELALNVGEHTYVFPDPADFGFALSGRTCVPAEKINALVDASDERLLQEGEAIKQAERRFADALSGVLADVDDVNVLLTETKLSVISQDNDWREIISALKTLPAGYEQYKKIAIIKYMQYMVSRQDIVKGLYHHRQALKPGAEKAASMKKAGGKPLGDTGIFEYMAFAEPATESDALKRLPKGETLEVELSPDTTFGLRLARCACTIVNRGDLIFVDNNGLETPVRNGKNIVGRDATADIVMDANLRDISRKHLVIDKIRSNVFRLTDISTHGTSVEPRYLADTGI